MNASTPTRILLADDHILVRAGIRALIETLPCVHVVAEASDGGEVIRLVEENQVDLVLMDIAMPGQTGLEAARSLSEKFPQVKVIILSIYTDDEHVHQALRAGAVGYLVKAAAFEELELAIRAAIRGETYLSPPISRTLVTEYIRRTGRGAGEILSPRQTEILRLIAKGNTTKQIAFDLGISAKTVESHRAKIMERLNLHDLASLVRYAIKSGLVEIE